MKRILLLTLSALLLPSFSARADEASDAKNLKNLALQVRTLQTEKNDLLRQKQELETKNKALEELTKKQAESAVEMDKKMKADATSAKAIQEEQSAKIASLDKELAAFKASLDKWQSAHATISEIAKKKEAERAKFSAKAADLERKLTDCRAKNAELYKTGMEILERYKRFGIGEALAAREPFTGNAKVKLQNLVQDYGDKLLDQTAKQ